MYKTTLKGTPFLVKELSVSKSIFNGSPVKVVVKPFSEKGVTGSATTENLTSAIKAALGEHIERSSLYLNVNVRTKNVNAFDLSTYEVKEIPAYKVYLNYSSKLFRNDNLTNEYSDSCGVASHLTSFKAINSAFLEFFERQSFVHNWLTKSYAEKISMEFISDQKIMNLYNQAFQYIDEIFLYNISVHKNVFVVLVLGFGEHHMGIGISADWNLEGAVYKALKETFEMFVTKKSKYYFKNNNISNVGNNGKELNRWDPHFYSNYFFNNYNPDELKKDYSYLIGKSTKMSSEGINKKEISEAEFYRNVKEISEDLNIDILLVYIPTYIKTIRTKIVKILSIKGYPHMQTELIIPEKYNLSRHLGVTEFPNRYRPIPFP